MNCCYPAPLLFLILHVEEPLETKWCWGTLFRLPRLNEEEGGDDVKSVWPLRPGLHTYYNAQYRRILDREVEEITKTGPSSD